MSTSFRLRPPPRRALLAALLVAALAAPALAHHGWSSYDSERPVSVSGTFVEVDYSNPHVVTRIETADATWEVVLAPVSRMQARGATEDLVKVGESVEAYGYPSREQPHEMRAERITVAGKTIDLR